MLFAMALQVSGEALVLSGKKKKYNCVAIHVVITSEVPGDIHQITLENSVASR